MLCKIRISINSVQNIPRHGFQELCRSNIWLWGIHQPANNSVKSLEFLSNSWISVKFIEFQNSVRNIPRHDFRGLWDKIIWLLENLSTASNFCQISRISVKPCISVKSYEISITSVPNIPRQCHDLQWLLRSNIQVLRTSSSG